MNTYDITELSIIKAADGDDTIVADRTWIADNEEAFANLRHVDDACSGEDAYARVDGSDGDFITIYRYI